MNMKLSFLAVSCFSSFLAGIIYWISFNKFHSSSFSGWMHAVCFFLAKVTVIIWIFMTGIARITPSIQKWSITKGIDELRSSFSKGSYTILLVTEVVFQSVLKDKSSFACELYGFCMNILFGWWRNFISRVNLKIL